MTGSTPLEISKVSSCSKALSTLDRPGRKLFPGRCSLLEPGVRGVLAAGDPRLGPAQPRVRPHPGRAAVQGGHPGALPRPLLGLLSGELPARLAPHPQDLLHDGRQGGEGPPASFVRLYNSVCVFRW